MNQGPLDSTPGNDPDEQYGIGDQVVILYKSEEIEGHVRSVDGDILSVQVGADTVRYNKAWVVIHYPRD